MGRTPIDANASWHHEPHPLLEAISLDSPRHASSLVTFGHVLAQTHSQSDAIENFADLISRTLAANSLLLAYDAMGASTAFNAGRTALMDALRNCGCQTDMMLQGSNYFSANITR